MTNSLIGISEVGVQLLCLVFYVRISLRYSNLHRVQLLCLVSHVRISLRYSNLHDMTNSIIEISEVRVQLLC